MEAGNETPAWIAQDEQGNTHWVAMGDSGSAFFTTLLASAVRRGLKVVRVQHEEVFRRLIARRVRWAASVPRPPGPQEECR